MAVPDGSEKRPRRFWRPLHPTDPILFVVMVAVFRVEIDSLKGLWNADEWILPWDLTMFVLGMGAMILVPWGLTRLFARRVSRIPPVAAIMVGAFAFMCWASLAAQAAAGS